MAMRNCSRVSQRRRFKTLLLQQAEEGLHGRVVTGRADAAHRSDHVVTAQGANEFSAAKLRPAVAVHHAAGDVAAPCHCTAERRGGQS